METNPFYQRHPASSSYRDYDILFKNKKIIEYCGTVVNSFDFDDLGISTRAYDCINEKRISREDYSRLSNTPSVIFYNDGTIDIGNGNLLTLKVIE